MAPPLPTKRSVALVIREGAESTRVLAVQRPAHDDDLPLAWGLPAASLTPDESWEDAARRAAWEKLGVEVEPVGVLSEGSRQRASYTLHMRLYEATLVAGDPRVEQPERGVTRYVDWKWAEPAELAPAAERGSLCSRLFLEQAGLRRS